MVTIYWAGGEDIDCYQVGGNSISTTSGRFRSTYARCSLAVASTSSYWQNYVPFSATTFWFSARVYLSSNSTDGASFYWLGDSAQIFRLRIQSTTPSGTYKVLKTDNSGTSTQLGSNFTMNLSNGASVDKLDTFINYNTSGTITIYLNGVQQFTYSGDITTNSVTTLTSFGLGKPGSSPSCEWSEIIVSDTDTRSWNLQTLAPVANGNTHNFDTGTPAASNVNEITLNVTTLDGSTTAGQIDQYTIPSIATGTFSIIAVGISSFMQKGATGPSKMDLGVRVSTTDYWSSDLSLTTTWADYQNWWLTDPSTSSVWTALPINIGLKSVT